MKKIILFLLIFVIAAGSSVSVYAAGGTVPYVNYTYSEADGSVVTGPQAYIPGTVVYGNTLGIGEFSYPTDIDADSQGDIYLLDAGNSRIVVIDKNLNYKTQFKCTVDGKAVDLSAAQGLTVTDESVYICDTDKSRVLIYNKSDAALKQIVNAPKSYALDDDFIFKPVRISVDAKGDMYIVSSGTYEGVINLKPNGDFVTFFAANKVTSDAWDLFWRNFSTKKQRKTMTQLIPQDFASIDIDRHGFMLISTYTPVNNSMVKRVNSGGSNVIRSLSSVNIVGDGAKNSSFSDISSGPDKIFACLDKKTGRIFCYNHDGYLLYTFGAIAAQNGGFKNPVSLTYLDDYRIAVLDTDRASLTVFNTTEYADIIHKATKFGNELNYDEASENWKKVLEMNSNFSLAIKMIGNRYYEAGDYETAKQYFKQCDSKELYSNARREIRSNWIYKNAWIVMLVILLIAVVSVGLKIHDYSKEKKSKQTFKN